jgi:threonine dehydrogenase-like Zn-dependent dehydrogenase
MSGWSFSYAPARHLQLPSTPSTWRRHNGSIVERHPQNLRLSAHHAFAVPARCLPARRFLPDLIEMVWSGKIIRGKVFDLTLPLAHVAEGHRAMDERRAIKVLLQP